MGRIAMSYRVRNGDSPWRIARALTGEGARWPELVRANPHKATNAAGNFRHLSPGEVLSVPPSWAGLLSPGRDTAAAAPSIPESATWTWTTDADGFVIVNGDRISLGSDSPASNAFDAHVWRWASLAKLHGDRNGVPTHWILGMVYAESGGDPDAKSFDGGYGLMQLTSAAARQGFAYDALRDPDLNIRLGAEFIRKIVRTGDDLPRVAAKYNAGSVRPSTDNPWGMHSTGNHISRVVKAANYALERLLTEPVPPAPVSEPSSSGGLPSGVGLAMAMWALRGLDLL